jgi:PAS domain S-box-containing protein
MLSGNLTNSVFELLLIHKNGHNFWVQVKMSVVSEPHSFFVIQIEDISDKKVTMEIYEEAKNSSITTFNTIQESILIMAPDGKVFHANETAARRLNKSVEQLIGQSVFDCILPKIAKKRRSLIHKVVETGKPLHHRDHRNGRLYDHTIYPILDRYEKVIKVAVYARDITDLSNTLKGLKQREKQQAAVAKFGNYAIVEKDLILLMKRAAEIITLTLRVNCTGVSEISQTGSKPEMRVAAYTVNGKVAFVDEAQLGFDISDSVSGYVIKTGKPLLVGDVENETRFTTDLLIKFGVKSTIVVPLKLHDKVYGTLAAQCLKKRNFSKQDIHFCEAIANILASSIERNRAENALKISEANFRAIVEDQTDLICRFSSDGTITFVNNVLCNMLRKKPDELINMDLKSFIPVDSHMEFLKSISNLTQDKPTISIEHRINFTKYKTTWINFTTRAIFGDDGNLIGFQTVGHDITEKKHAELLLAEREKYYRQLVEFLPDAIFISLDYKFAFVNNAFLKLLNVSSQSEILGKNVLDFIHPDYHIAIKNKVNEIHKEGIVSQPSERKLFRSDGSIVEVESSAAPFLFKGRQATLVVIRDLTERKRNKELHLKMEEKSRLLNEAIEYDKLKTEFFSNISHELKTPLSVIFVTLQLLKLKLERNKMYYEDIGRHMSVMKQNSYRLLKLVNNIIDITKIDAKFYTLNLENRNIVKIVRDVTLSVEDYIRDKKLELQFTSLEDKKIIAIDVEKIERVMLNLLSNAVKFTHPGGKITVSIHTSNENVKIAVKDSGIGIPEEKLDLIFERFMQVDKSLRRNHEGSGIGLSIVKSLVEMHGGKIYALSDYGKGSEFVVELPLNTVPDEPGGMIANGSIEQHGTGKVKIEFSDIL